MFVIEIKILCLSGEKLMSKLSIDQNQYIRKCGLPLIQVEHLSRVIETHAQKTTLVSFGPALSAVRVRVSEMLRYD